MDIILSDPHFFLLSALITLIVIVIFVPILKILVMVDVFGWEKTKELIKFPRWLLSYGNGAWDELDTALEELEMGNHPKP